MEPVLAITALGAIATWLQVKIAEDVKLKEKERLAVDALFEAANATQKYSNKTKPPIGSGSKKRDTEFEFEIAQLWAKASDYLYQIDPNLASRCDTKAAYWHDPKSKKWKSAHSELAKVKLKNIMKEARKLRRDL